MASSLAIAAIPVGGAGSLAIMALGYYGRLQGATAQLGAVDSVRLQKEVVLSDIEEKIAKIEFSKSGKEQDDAALQSLLTQRDAIEKQIAGIEAGRKVVIRRGYRLRKMMTLLLIAISLAVFSGLWTTLTHYWSGFHWFAVISLLSAFVSTIISVIFAMLELREGVFAEEVEHRRVLLSVPPVWKGPLHVLELRVGSPELSRVGTH